jgi:hypothetical protein
MAATGSVYLVNPIYDLTFICGGLVLALSAMCIYQFGLDAQLAQKSTPIILLGIFGTYVLSAPHNAATLFRLYGEAQNRRRFKFVSYVLPAILIVAFAAGLFIQAVAKVEAILYLILIWHHVMAQCYGIAMMYCARAGLRLTSDEKVLPKAILYLAVAVAISQQFTPDWQRKFFLQIFLEPMAFLPTPLVTLLQFLLFAAMVILVVEQTTRARKGESAIPLPALAAILAGGFLLSMGRSLSELVWIFVPAFFHASQYLSVVFAYHLKKGAEKNETGSLLNNLEYLGNRFAEFFLLGLVLFSALPFVISAMGFPLYLCSALVFFTINLHHFAADACIWKLKDKSVLSRLVP